MNILRKIQKSIEEYQILLNTDTESAKKNSKEYLNDIICIEVLLEKFIEEATEELKKWCDISVSNFFNDSTNIFLKIKRQIDMAIINHYLYKISGELAIAGKCQARLNPIKERFIQFEYLIS